MFEALNTYFNFSDKAILNSEITIGRILTAFSLLSIILWFVFFFEIIFLESKPWGALGISTILLLGLAYLSLNKQIAYAWRAHGVLMIVLAAGIVDTATSATNDIPLLIMVLLTLMALVLLGLWQGVAYGVLSTAIIVSAIVWGGQGMLPLGDVSNNSSSWLVDILYYCVLVVLTVITLWQLLFESDVLHVNEIEAIEALQQEQENLRQLVSARLRALQAANEMSQRLTRILDEDAMLETAVSLVRDTWALEFAGVYQSRPTQLKLKYSAGSKKTDLPHALGLIEQANEGGLVQFEPNIGEPVDHDVQQLAAVPLWIEKQVWAVLLLVKPAGMLFADQDVYIIQTIASQIAVAWQNAIIYSQTEKQAQYETALGLIGDKIAATETVDGAIETAVRELSKQLSASQADIQLGLPKLT